MSGPRTPALLRRFVSLRSDVEAVVQRCGAHTFDLLLVDLEGDWVRSVFPSREAAEGAARELGVRLHHGWGGDDRLARRMSAYDAWRRTGGRRRAL